MLVEATALLQVSHEVIVHPQLTPSARTRQDDRLRLAKCRGTRPKQLARDYHRIEHLDTTLTQQLLHCSHPAVTRLQRRALVTAGQTPSIEVNEAHPAVAVANYSHRTDLQLKGWAWLGPQRCLSYRSVGLAFGGSGAVGELAQGAAARAVCLRHQAGDVLLRCTW